MSTNQTIRDAQAGNQPAIVDERRRNPQLSLLAAARTAGVSEGDVIKVLDRIGASCQIEQILVNGPVARSVIVRLEPGNEVPWHRHTRATNVYLCLTTASSSLPVRPTAYRRSSFTVSSVEASADS
jgi:hypothetical protein